MVKELYEQTAKIKQYFKRAISGNITMGTFKLPRAMVFGVLGVVFMYTSVAGIVSITTPWVSTSDSKQHIDYIWRVYNKELPRWDDGLTYSPFTRSGYHGHQSASSNPPMFYVLHAPFVGPFLARGNIGTAIALGRVINIGLGVLCVFVLAWGGWLLAGRRKALFAVAVPAIAVLLYRFTRLNMDFALEPLLVLLSTLSLILSYKIIHQGLNKKLAWYLVILSSAGMLTKASYVIFIATNLLAVMVSIYIRNHNYKDIITRTLIATTVVIVAVVATSGWFYYYWNFKSNGGWFHSSPIGYTGGRSFRSLSDVLSSSTFWGLLYADFAKHLEVSVAILSFSLAGYLTIQRDAIKKTLGTSKRRGMMIVLGAAMVGVFLVQIKFAFGYGSINFRYLLPAMLPLGVFISYGLLQFPGARGLLIVIASMSMGISSIMGIMRGDFGKVYTDAAKNSVPSVFISLMFFVFIIGSLILSWSLYTLTKQNHKG